MEDIYAIESSNNMVICMGIEQKVKSYIETEIRFTGKNKIKIKDRALLIDSVFELAKEKYHIGDYIHFFFDDYIDLQASEGHVFEGELIGKVEAIVYKPQTKHVILELDGVYVIGWDNDQKRLRYLPAYDHPVYTLHSLDRIKRPRKITKKEYKGLVRG